MPWLVATEAHDGSGIVATIITTSSMMFLGMSRLGGTPWLGFSITTVGGSQWIWIEGF
jgi:hypothetical protein